MDTDITILNMREVAQAIQSKLHNKHYTMIRKNDLRSSDEVLKGQALKWYTNEGEHIEPVKTWLDQHKDGTYYGSIGINDSYGAYSISVDDAPQVRHSHIRITPTEIIIDQWIPHHICWTITNIDPVSGYIPGGEDRAQWIFEGDRGDVWTKEEMAPIIDEITSFVLWYREHYGKSVGDMINYFSFKFMQDPDGSNRLYFMSRRSWRYNHMKQSLGELVDKLREVIEEDKNWKLGIAKES